MTNKISIALPSMATQKEIVKQEKTGNFDGIRIETRVKYSEGWIQPTHLEVRTIISKLGLTGSEAANITGVSPRTVRKWQADPEGVDAKKSAQKIPYAAWRLLVIELENMKPGGNNGK